MTQHQPSKEEVLAVFPTVAKTIADALGCDVEDVKLDVSLIEGLDAESIDFLDLVFRLERAFKLKIPRGKIIEEARGDLPEAEFEHKGVVTEAGMQRVRTFLSEVPADRFPTADESGGHRRACSPRRPSASWWCAHSAPPPRSGDCPDHQCIARALPGLLFRRSDHRPRGGQARPGPLPGSRSRAPLLPCLAIEAAGQLAAWVTMAALDFRLRPVAGVAADLRFGAEVRPGAVLDLRAEIHKYDEEAVDFSALGAHGRRAGGRDRAQRRPDASDRGLRQPRRDT